MRIQYDPSRPPRRLWPWPWLMLAIAVALVIGIIVTFWPRGAAPPEPTPSPSSQPPTPAPTTEPTEPRADPLPTGCLGGPGLDAAMLLTTLDRAPHTANGAVEVAASWRRFVSQYPYPSAEDIAAAERAAESPDGETVSDFYAAEPDVWGDTAPEGTPMYYSSANGEYFVESYDGDTARIALVLHIVVDGAVVMPVAASGTTLAWNGEHWVVTGAYVPDPPAELQQRSAPFSGGC